MGAFRLSRRSVLGGIPALSFAYPLRAVASMNKSLVLCGGNIYTGASGRIVDALAIRDGRIVYAGDLANLPRNFGTVINLEGASAFPGLIDSHVHLPLVGLRELRLNLDHVRSIRALQSALKEYAEKQPSGPIVGWGWIETHWPEGRMINRLDIDAVVADRPVYLTRSDGHALVVNSVALAQSGINADTADPAGGKIDRDAAGQPTGLLIDRAKSLVEKDLPELDSDTMRRALKEAVNFFGSLGWTGVSDMRTTFEVRAILHEMALAGELPIRVDCYMDSKDAIDVLTGGPSVDATGLVRTLGVKLFTDGALGSRGALLSSPYTDRPETSGLQVTPIEDLRSIMMQARVSGAQVATHAIGDKANRIVLDLYEEVWSDNLAGLRQARWRIEHAQVIAQEDIVRFGQLGVIASMQPSHAIGDLYFAPSRLGSERVSGAYAWRSLTESGALICGGSDAPVEKGDPRIEIYAATSRHALNGESNEGWHLEQALGRSDALSLFTSNAAFAARDDRSRGTLEIGMSADISVFDQDLLNAAPKEILKAVPKMTIVGGTVFSKQQ